MSTAEKKSLKDAVKEYRRLEAVVEGFQAKEASARVELVAAFQALNELTPHGEPAVVSLGKTTIVLSRDRGVGDVQIQNAA